MVVLESGIVKWKKDSKDLLLILWKHVVASIRHQDCIVLGIVPICIMKEAIHVPQSFESK